MAVHIVGSMVSAMTTFANPAALLDAVGTDLGVTDWIEITQDRIDTFADATGDHQWIHVDPERAAEGPFGTTIAHGYLTLSLTNQFLPELLEVQNVTMGVNYGVDKVRFPAPVPVGSRIRGAATISGATEIAGGVQVTVTITVEIDGAPKPACVVESISRFM
jgi:acyl dehydratase